MIRSLLYLLLSILYGCKSSEDPNLLPKIIAQARNDCQSGKPNLAIQNLESHLNYNNLDLIETLAFAYESNGNLLLAAQMFEQLLHLDLKNSYMESAFYAAQIYEQLGDDYSAARCYQLYLDHSPKDASIWFSLSACEERLNHLSTALSAYLKGIQLQTTHTPDEFKRLAQLCYQANLYDAAEFWAKKALGQNVLDPSIIELLLNIADQHNDHIKANQYISKLEDLHYPFSESMNELKMKYKSAPFISKTTDLAHPVITNSSESEIEHTLRIFQMSPSPASIDFVVPIDFNLLKPCPPYIY